MRVSAGPVTSLGAALAAVLPFASHALAQESPLWLFGDVSFPAQVDTFVIQGAEVAPEAAGGTVLHYRTDLAPRATVDVLVYPLPEGRGDPEVVRQEFRRTLERLHLYEGDGRERVSVSVDTVRAVTVEAGGWTYEGHVAEATVRGAGSSDRTLAWLFAKPPSFVEFRMTYAPAFESALEPRIRTFLREFLGRLESFQDRRTTGGP